MSKKQTVTVDQFKAWLEGIEDMQPKTWHPDAAQWKKIRAKIRQLIDGGLQPGQPPTHASSMIEEEPTSPMPFDAPAPPSRFERLRVEDAVPSTLAPVPAAADPRGDIASPDVKTPDIDTSRGSYESPFS